MSSIWPSSEDLARILPARDGVTIHVLKADEVDDFVADLGRWYGALAVTSEAQMLDPSFFYQHAIRRANTEPSLLVLIAWVEGVRSAVTMLELDPVTGGLLGRFCTVDPACRGRRLASLLVEAQVEIAHAIGAPHTHALTELNNQAAGNAFVRHEFDVVALYPASETKRVQGVVRYVHEVLFLLSLRDGRLKQPVPANLHPATAALYQRRVMGMGDAPAMVKGANRAPMQSFPPTTGRWPKDLKDSARWFEPGAPLPNSIHGWARWAFSRTAPSVHEWLARMSESRDGDGSDAPSYHTLLWLDNGQVVGLLGLGRDPTGEWMGVHVAATAPDYEAVALPMLQQVGSIAAAIGVRQVQLRTALSDAYHQQAAELAGLRVMGILPADKTGEWETLQILSLVPGENLNVPPMETMLPEVARFVAGLI